MNSKIGFAETPLDIAELMLDLSKIKTNEYVLDTGFGTGIFLNALINKNYKNITGIDISKEFYEICKNKFADKIKLINDDFLNFDFNNQFNLIIGNPPYVHFNALPLQLQSKLKKIFSTSEIDIYYAFILKSIQLLKENGELIYIVPYHFFYNTHAKKIREYLLENGYFETIIDLDETKLFYKENPETIIFKFIKSNKFKNNLASKKINVLKIIPQKTTPKDIHNAAMDALKNKQSNYLFEYYELPHYTNNKTWSTSKKTDDDFDSFLYLNQISKVGVGLVSGFDKAFLISEHIYSKLNKKEKLFVKKFIKAKNCERFITVNTSLYFILEDSNFSEEYISKHFPNFYELLKPYKSELQNRYLPNNKKWYQWQALRNYEFILKNLHQPKIFVPVLDRSLKARFSLSFENVFPSGDVLFIQPYNQEYLFYLLGYLNSSFFRTYYLSNGARRGKRISFTQRILNEIKIPLFNSDTFQKISLLSKKIFELKKNKIETSDLENELDQIILNAIKNKDYSNVHYSSKLNITEKYQQLQLL
jgi:adenine-specific DNA-methyltransferase